MNAIAKNSQSIEINTKPDAMVVSRQWMSRPDDERFLNLYDLRDHVSWMADTSTANVIEGKALNAWAPEPEKVADLDVLRLDVAGQQADFTNWSFGQLASLIKAPAGYLQKLPAQIVRDNVNWGLRNHRSEMLKTYVRADGRVELRAVTGPDYGRILDRDVVDSVIKVAGNGVGETHWQVPAPGGSWATKNGISHHGGINVTKESTTLYASDRDVFIFLIDAENPIEIGRLPNGDPDVLMRGFYVWNSEVGSKTAGIATMYLRGVCMNRILWGIEGFQEISIRHTKHGPDRFLGEALPALEGYAHGSTQTLLEGVKAAQEAKVAADQEEAITFLRNRGLSKKLATSALERHEAEEGKPVRSIWDFANALTAEARTIQNADARIDLERAAGALLEKV